MEVITMTMEEFLEMLESGEEMEKNVNIEVTDEEAENITKVMEKTVELKFTISELIDLSIALFRYLDSGAVKELSFRGTYQCLELKDRIDEIISLEFNKAGIDV